MLASALQGYVDAMSDGMEIGVVVHSIETGEEIATSFDVVVDISEYGELLLSISI
jgi:hypothetical protein